MNKVIYTAIFGGYDDIVEPIFKPDGWDFVCFTDSDLKSDNWEIRKVTPYYSDSTRNARKYKVLPHRWFSDYKYSCWVDGNAQVRNDVNDLMTFIQDCNLATYDHAQCHLDPRNCLYEEAKTILYFGHANTNKCRQNNELYKCQGQCSNDNPFHHYKDNPKVIETQVNRYFSEGYPQNNGLLSSMVLLRRHNENDCIETMEKWWEEIQYGSKRDQLSFNYSAWKKSFKFNYLIGDVRTNDYFLHMGAHTGK